MLRMRQRDQRIPYNSGRLAASVLLCVLGVLLSGPSARAAQFHATPLTDFTATQRYLTAFPGKLYANSNTIPAQHEADGLAFAHEVVPLDLAGNPNPSGKIVVIGVGMSNWTEELCTARLNYQVAFTCKPNSFFSQANSNSFVNHQTLVLIDCAAGSQTAPNWISDAKGNYTGCDDVLAAAGLSPLQVQVVLWKDADGGPTVSLKSSTNCTTWAHWSPTIPDACSYISSMGASARFIKIHYPNTKQMFLHSRAYGGYATGTLNPEPYAYQYGFATKWLIQAQIDQISGASGIDPNAGDLSYTAVPWLAWGPYFWASGETPRSDGLTWSRDDFLSDGVHPSALGVSKIAKLMMDFYVQSPVTPWFRKPPFAAQ